MFLHQSNAFIRSLFPSGFTWQKPSAEKTIYLTFDDGPVPDITEQVLEMLQKYRAKATFFCVGDNLRKHPQVFEKVRQQDHATENHTFHHLSGWATPPQTYLQNTDECQAWLDKPARLFRPPYGRITRPQAQLLQQRGYEIVMWDVLSGDFERSVSPETCLRKSLQYTRQGSITLFHDSQKAHKNMSYTLPRYLEHFSEKGFVFESL